MTREKITYTNIGNGTTLKQECSGPTLFGKNCNKDAIVTINGATYELTDRCGRCPLNGRGGRGGADYTGIDISCIPVID